MPCAGVHGAALSFHGSRDTVCNTDVRVRAESGAIDGGAMGVAEEMELCGDPQARSARSLLLAEGDSPSMW